MKPAPFLYESPTSVEEALEALARTDGEGKLLAGGQSLVPVMNMRLARPEQVIDLNRVIGLDYINCTASVLRIGAMTRHVAVERSEDLQRLFPLLPAVARLIGHPQIRTRGTIGGSLVHADPAAEWPVVAALTGARMLIRSREGERELTSDQFFLGVLTTAIEPTEILVAVEFPLLQPGTGWSFQEVARRQGDFALVSAAALVRFDGSVPSDIRVVLGGVGQTPFDASPLCAPLVGLRLSELSLGSVSRAIAAALDPDSDIHATASYRRQVAQALVERSLREAISRASGTDANGR